MPRVIFKCPHIQPGTKGAAAHLGHYVRYVATREGVELPAARRENYVGYIAQRPRSHGLFGDTEEPPALSEIAKEVASHPGTVWLPILSLGREDAARLGYDNANQWQTLLRAYAPAIAEAMKIPLEQFRWYAAFHDEGHHPHVHMVCYSEDGKSGFLTREGIAKIKSGLAKEIFRQELTAVYQRQTQQRDKLVQNAGEIMDDLVQQMKIGTLENENIEYLMRQLSQKLKTTSGKKQYGYLRAPAKALVDEIVEELAKDPRIAAAYDLWYQLWEEVLRTYKEDLPERLPLSRQKEFKRIKNLVIEEAVRLVEHKMYLKGENAHPWNEHTLSVDSSRPVLTYTTRLLHYVGSLFQERTPLPAAGVRFTDSKLRRKIREKKIALGHRPDDHTPTITS